jgi:hypothetical protein
METARIEPNPHVPLADRVARKTDSRLLLSGVDFAPLGFSDSREVEGTIAFAGYGLHVRDDDGTLIYDSYADLDVRDRIVVVLRYVPERMETERRALFNRFSSLRHKAMLARERGAVGLLVVEGPNAPSPGRLIPLESDLGGSAGIVAASVTPEAAERMLASAEVSFREIADRLDSGEPAPGFVLEDAYARIAVELAVETGVGRNVVGRLAPTFGSATGNLVVGAHYDHLGLGGGGSLAREGERGRIHPGADDNASGTAAMLEIAERMATSGAERRSGVVFAAWSGEELGLLGSTAFLQSSAVDPESIVAYLNMDMVGRVNENKLSVQAVGSSPDWRGLIERKNVVAGFALALADDPYLPTDTTAFYLKKIPGLHFFSGTHEDYHRPTDTADRIEYAALTRVARFVESIASEIVGRGLKPAYAEVERSGSMEGSRDAMRVYLGTIPDYVANVKGLALGGVTAGSPADRGGLRAGDVIVEFGGIEIANIYDYTIALDSARVGEPVEVVVVRGGERVELTVTPAARR